jgi:hypothetical protein
MAVLIWIILLAAIGFGVCARRRRDRHWDHVVFEVFDKTHGHRPVPPKYL